MNDNLNFPDDDSEGGTLRWMSIVIVIVAVGGFFALAWYAYNAGTQTMTAESDIATVKADATPLKETPEEPGGWQFPHQDKTVYEAISPNDAKEDTVEHIMPEPAEPTPPATADADDADKDEPSEAAEESVDDENEQAEAPKADEPKPETTPSVKVVEMDKKTESGPKRVELKPVSPMPMPPQEDKAQAAAKEAEPKQTNALRDAIVKAEKEQAEKSAAKPAETMAAKPEEKEDTQATESAAKEVAKAAPSAGSDKIRAQLGAFRSKDEAEASWKKISGKFPQVSDKKHDVVRADLGAKGIYYRLQVMPFTSTDAAKQFCKPLSAKGQGCLPVNVP